MVTDDKSTRRPGRGPGKKWSAHRDLAMLWSRSERLTASEIAVRLADHPRLGGDHPDQRTIERWMIDAQGAGPTWALGSGDGSGMSDAAIVLRALGTLAWVSGERRASLSEEEAEWTVRIARSAPTIDPFTAYQIGKLYRDRALRGRETRSLDVYLGTAPWDDDARYRNIIENDGVEEWFGQGWHPSLELVFRQHYDGLPTGDPGPEEPG